MTFYINLVVTVRVVISGKRRLTIREVADDLGVVLGSCHQIFAEELQMPGQIRAD